MSVTKLKNPVKFVLEGIFIVLVESTEFEKKTQIQTNPQFTLGQSEMFPLRGR